MTRRTVRSLPQLLSFVVDNRGRTCPTSDSGIPLIATNCLKEGKREAVFENIRYVDESTHATWFRAHPNPGDILFVCKGSPGRVAVVPDPVPYCIAQDMVALRADPAVVNANYLYYRLRSSDVRESIGNMHVGTMIPHFKKGDFGKLKFAIHDDISEQQAIAEFLGALDDKIAVNDQVAVAALSLADALFLVSLQRDAGTPTTIGELADRGVLALGDGYRTKQAEHGQPGLRILRAGDIRDGRIIPEGADFVSKSYVRQIGQKASQSNDIVMTTKGSVGRVAVVPADLETVVYSPQICYFRVLDEDALDRGYLAAWFRSSSLQTQASQLMFKSDMAPYINLRDIRSLTVPVPNRVEQRKQGEFQRSLLDIIHAAHSENRRLERTRDELLPLLMSGKVRVRDAEKSVEGVV